MAPPPPPKKDGNPPLCGPPLSHGPKEQEQQQGVKSSAYNNPPPTPRCNSRKQAELRDRKKSGIEKKAQCSICYEEFPDFYLAELDCKHRCCSECLSELFRGATKEEARYPPRCCEAIPLETARPYINIKIAEEYEKKKVEWDTKNRTYCSDEKCREFIGNEHIFGKVAYCPDCARATCIGCKKKAHGRSPCAEDEETTKAIALMKEKGWRRCYQCNAGVELIAGCNHLTCTCGAEFCHLCGAKWTTCRCQLYGEPGDENDDNRRRHPDAADAPPEMRRQRLAQLAEYRERFPQHRAFDAPPAGWAHPPPAFAAAPPPALAAPPPPAFAPPLIQHQPPPAAVWPQQPQLNYYQHQAPPYYLPQHLIQRVPLGHAAAALQYPGAPHGFGRFEGIIGINQRPPPNFDQPLDWDRAPHEPMPEWRPNFVGAGARFLDNDPHEFQRLRGGGEEEERKEERSDERESRLGLLLERVREGRNRRRIQFEENQERLRKERALLGGSEMRMRREDEDEGANNSEKLGIRSRSQVSGVGGQRSWRMKECRAREQ